MEQPCISVVVPVYKVEKYLPQCVMSLLEQTYTNLEIILVDDGSPDNCPTICDNFSNNNRNIRVVHKKNGGATSARKAGVSVSTGEYICFVDGDDWVKNNHFDNVAKAIINSRADIIIHGYSEYYSCNSKCITKGMEPGYYGREEIKVELLPTLISKEPFYSPGIVPSVWGKAFKRELLLPIQMSVPEEITIGEDAAVSYPAIAAAESIEIINDCGYMYRINNSSITRTYDKRLAANLPILLGYLQKVLSENQNYILLEKQLEDYICFMTLGTISNELRGPLSLSDAIEKLQVVITSPLINNTIKKRNTKIKIKIAFYAVEKRNIILSGLLKMIWNR